MKEKYKKALKIIIPIILFWIILGAAFLYLLSRPDLKFYCVPEKVFVQKDWEYLRSWHGTDNECASDEIKRQFVRYFWTHSYKFRVNDVIRYKKEGKRTDRVFGRVESVEAIGNSWSYDVLTVDQDQNIFTEKVLHKWIVGRD